MTYYCDSLPSYSLPVRLTVNVENVDVIVSNIYGFSISYMLINQIFLVNFSLWLKSKGKEEHCCHHSSSLNLNQTFLL